MFLWDGQLVFQYNAYEPAKLEDVNIYEGENVEIKVEEKPKVEIRLGEKSCFALNENIESITDFSAICGGIPHILEQ